MPTMSNKTVSQITPRCNMMITGNFFSKVDFNFLFHLKYIQITSEKLIYYSGNLLHYGRQKEREGLSFSQSNW